MAFLQSLHIMYTLLQVNLVCRYIFIIISFPQLLTEESLIDFHKLLGHHTGENLVDAVWDTLRTFGIQGKVSIIIFLTQAVPLTLSR